MDGDGWVGVLVRPGRREIIALLQSEVAAIMALRDVKERLAALGSSGRNASQEFEAQLRTEMEKWAKVIRAANIKVP